MMAAGASELIVRHIGPVTELRLNRPALHNAFNEALIEAMGKAVAAASADPAVRVLVLAAEGRSFCAGADLAWMRSLVGASERDNARDAHRLAGLFRALDGCPKPVVARVHGAALGGGVGLTSCADIAIAAESATFGLSEVRLGLAPAVISPFVMAKIGRSAARRYFLTGERFDAATALRLGLVHEVVPGAGLDAAVNAVVDALLAGGPRAQQACKALTFEVPALGQNTEAVDAHTAAVIARLRVGEEGQEGMRAFLDKREPAYVAARVGASEESA